MEKIVVHDSGGRLLSPREIEAKVAELHADVAPIGVLSLYMKEYYKALKSIPHVDVLSSQPLSDNSEDVTD